MTGGPDSRSWRTCMEAVRRINEPPCWMQGWMDGRTDGRSRTGGGNGPSRPPRPCHLVVGVPALPPPQLSSLPSLPGQLLGTIGLWLSSQLTTPEEPQFSDITATFSDSAASDPERKDSTHRNAQCIHRGTSMKCVGTAHQAAQALLHALPRFSRSLPDLAASCFLLVVFLPP